MADSKPSFDPHRLLDQIKGFTSKSKDKAGGKASWVTGAIAAVLAILASFAVWSFISWRRNKELAKLRHEKNKAKILAEKADTDLLVAKGDEQIKESIKNAKIVLERIRVVEADIRAEESRYEADMRAIDSIRSWDDIGIR